ncbi:MAG: 50S ribosomal protein L25 [Chitinophagales bacterium]
METVHIKAELRKSNGKKAAKDLRTQGMVLGNLYGGKENVQFYAPYASFRAIVYTPDFKLAAIEIDGKTYKAILKELQFDPITDMVKHLDFQELVEDKPVRVEVPLRFTGTPKAAAMGGKVEQTMRKLSIFALPKDLPNTITIDVSDMDFGSIKRMKELSVPGVKILHSPNIPIARLAITRAVKEEAAAAAAAKPAAGAAAPAKAAEKKK